LVISETTLPRTKADVLPSARWGERAGDTTCPFAVRHPTDAFIVRENNVKKHTVGRAAGFLGAMGATAGLVAAGVNMTGAFFQDAEQGTVHATTGEVDMVVDAATPLSQNFGPLMPGEAHDSNTYSLRNVGTGPVDFYVASANWTGSGYYPGGNANPGTTILGDTIRLDANAAAGGTSYEWADLDVPVQGGDTITFEWRNESTDSACAEPGGNGGVPRLFIRGGGAVNNSHDAQLSTGGYCGTAPDADGWRTVTWVLDPSIAAGDAGYTGVVNDAPQGDGIMEYRNIVVDGQSLTDADFDVCGGPAGDHLEVRVNSATHDTGWQQLCNLTTGSNPILVSQDVTPSSLRNVDISLRLNGAAGNGWANKFGTADLIVVATQAGQIPTNQADQDGNDA
jgi:hypothetical protein